MYQKFYTPDEFKEIYSGTKSIEEEAHITNDNFCINYSSSLSALIHEAGRWCEYHASDLFIDYSIIMDKLKSGNLESNSYLFGFRQSGVDHKEFILNTYNRHCITRCPSEYYRAIWRLDVEVGERESYGSYTVKLTTYRVQIPY